MIKDDKKEISQLRQALKSLPKSRLEHPEVKQVLAAAALTESIASESVVVKEGKNNHPLDSKVRLEGCDGKDKE